MHIEYEPIGIIHSPYKELEGMPIQPKGAIGIKGTVKVNSEFEKGLKDLEGFSHIILLYHFHKSKGFKLEVVPFLDSKLRGLFATRTPKRPNGIGLSIVKLQEIEGIILHIENIDILDETPLLDIKPYIPKFDYQNNARIGWLENSQKQIDQVKSDERFT